ncbi:MAG: AmmeMemoRadiSam system protein A, partial [Candidatus Aminicenantales bacterium]
MENRFSPDQEKFLLAVARKAITQYLENRKAPEVRVTDAALRENRGAFVTLKVDGELRGCIGYPLPVKPLVETVIDAAISAATQDFRFAPLGKDELPRTKIEISVLSLPRPVHNISEIEVGKHGIIVSKGMNKGLLLPQVPVEWGWDCETFLAHGCLKAGLEENA